MQDAPIHCPADLEATEVEQAACEDPAKPKPGKPINDGALRSGGGGGDQPPKKPPVKED